MTPSLHAKDFQFLQAQFGELYGQKQRQHRSLVWCCRRNRTLAYALKGVAVASGLAGALNASPVWTHYLGMAVLAAVAVDGYFANHERLVVSTEARNALRRLLDEVAKSHTLELPVGQLNGAETQKEALGRAIDLLRCLIQQLQEGCDGIDRAIEEADLKLLKRLALDPVATLGPSYSPGADSHHTRT